jgi:glutamate-1-semialdehyde 2,1-aminomutase
MPTPDYTRLLAELAEDYERQNPLSAALHRRATVHLVDGGSHTLRLIRPFPPRIKAARGPWVVDEDDHLLLDFWQGHLANILGHNPPVVSEALARGFEEGRGLQTGLTERMEIEGAELLCRCTGAESARFTTSGSLATMYAMMLARAFTGRELVMKAGGGWHGAQPWGLKGVQFDHGYDVDSEGLTGSDESSVILTLYNEPEHLRDQFERHRDRLACLVLEPVLGAGGLIPAHPAYLQLARRLTERDGVLLILDEVITGFRFRAGDAGSMYGIRPDLATFGKIIGGGMPLAAVAGRADVMKLAGRESGIRVRFSGGTYSAHPAALVAGLTLMQYLVDHERDIYPRLAALGESARRSMVRAFREEGLWAECTGHGNGAIAGSSLVMVHFPFDERTTLDKPHVVFNSELCDVTLGTVVLELALLVERVHLLHAHGAVSLSHSEKHVDFLEEACRRAARRIKPHIS